MKNTKQMSIRGSIIASITHDSAPSMNQEVTCSLTDNYDDRTNKNQRELHSAYLQQSRSLAFHFVS